MFCKFLWETTRKQEAQLKWINKITGENTALKKKKQNH